jgi:hypothetical protein
MCLPTSANLEQLAHADTETGQYVASVEPCLLAKLPSVSIRVVHRHRAPGGPKHPDLPRASLQIVLDLA